MWRLRKTKMKKKIYILIVIALLSTSSFAQIICNPAGNLMLFTNYDGGELIINIDTNISNLKIGIVSYEAVSVTLQGAYVNNVTDVAYAGYNASNNTHCGSTIPTTVITGAPAGVTPTITNAPASPLTNTFGHASIICGYSCSTTTSQGGCNTLDQIEAYFDSFFTGSVLYAHSVQYGCWTGTQNISNGGTCCISITTETENILENNFSIYPNPFTSSTTLVFNNNGLHTIKIMDILGKEIKTINYTGKECVIERGTMQSGIYLIQTTDEKKQLIVKKMIIQ